jgi:hypothetical protein
MHFQPVPGAVKITGLSRYFPLPLIVVLTAAAALVAPVASAQIAGGLSVSPAVSRTPKEPIWQAKVANFTDADYDRAVQALFLAFENQTHKKIAPGPKKRVGLKIYTDSGPGLATPVPLVRAVIAALRARGFENKNIFLVGLNQLRMRMTGYLPSLVTGKTPFDGNPVYVLESGRYYDPVWFYDSPLPEKFDPIFAKAQVKDADENSTPQQDRKSFLDTPLFLDADFWINLPVYTDHQFLGVNGALVNATLWNASNTARFFRSPANAPAAVAEMSAIPELRETWLFTIASLQIYQFLGGPYFNSLYSRSEPYVWLSSDPVMMDALMRDRMNKWRQREGFDNIDDQIRTLEFAETLGVGSTRIKNAIIVPVKD